MNDEEKNILSEMREIIVERDNLRTEVDRLCGGAYISSDIVPGRKLTNATPSETLQEAVERVVRERDGLRTEVNRLRIPPPPLPPGYGPEAFTMLGNVLDRAYSETPLQAAERVARQRDALQQELDEIRVAVKAISKKSTLQAVQAVCDASNEARATSQAMARALGINVDGSLQQMLLGCEAQREELLQTRKSLSAIRVHTGALDAETTLDAVARVANLCRDLCDENQEIRDALSIDPDESILNAVKNLFITQGSLRTERDALRTDVQRIRAAFLTSCSDEIISIREHLGALPEDDTLGLVKRVVAARDKTFTDYVEARDLVAKEHQRAKNFRDQSDSKDCTISNLRSILGYPNVSLEEAARLVVKERNEAKQERDKAKAALRGPAAEFLDMARELQTYREEHRKLSDAYYPLLQKARGMVQVPFNCDIDTLFAAMDRYAERHSDRNNITDALGIPNTSTHAEVLAECIAARKFKETVVQNTLNEVDEAQNPEETRQMEEGDLVAWVALKDSHDLTWHPIDSIRDGRARYGSSQTFGMPLEKLIRKPIELGDSVRCAAGFFAGRRGVSDSYVGDEMRVREAPGGGYFTTSVSNLVAVD